MFGFKKIKSVFVTINSTVTKISKTSETSSKVVVTTVGSTSLVKGAFDIAEDLVCQDYVCLTVDCIGVCADVLTVLTSFIPGPNVTSVVTIPVSTSCKFFRWCCQRSMFNFGCKR
jgi:hypothetical protein